MIEKESGESFSTFSASVPRAGIEPAHLAVLVFETNASTYSAIWAYLRVQRYGIFSEPPNKWRKKCLKDNVFVADSGKHTKRHPCHRKDKDACIVMYLL